jgi:catechol 1,2-dioxygenase
MRCPLVTITEANTLTAGKEQPWSRTRRGDGWDECKPISNAQIEFWLANSGGDYDDAHRATVLAGQRGGYRFQRNVPVSYGGRPPHIHVRVTATGYEVLVAQHYPQRGQRKANYDLVLVAE